MTDIAELLERVRAATGPDADLDDAIWLAVVPGASRRNVMAKWAEEQPIWEYHDPERNVYGRNLVPGLTSSVDAALALVERKLPGWWWLRDDGQSIRLVGPDNGDCYPSAVGRHHLVPLAILAALLSALSSGDAS